MNAGVDLNKQNEYGDTALIWAANNNNSGLVKLLLDAKANPDIKGENGETALFSAANRNSREIIKILLDYNANISILNNDGESFFDHLNEENKE